MDFDATGWEIIHTYTRAQAIADEVLRDVTELAKEAGFTIPVAIAQHAWAAAVAWDQDGEHGQSITGRTWDVLMMARWAALRDRDASEVKFEVLRLVNGSTDTRPQPVTLYLHCGPGDTPEPVLTIMAPRDM
ncbi:hypothetical protein KO481_16940 [Nocardia sp. NEAU-G5]|uniref:Uncharacterized protein n=1 Tax=Nocardia albiluteola TaxID=2842303 RepID=A0ABS6B1V4_9NOCA|nr:DUF6573 family protein [Nocardia albiluteola]MBU3063208.1 hypothetical protein [Nocardia albiluteola]